jgi:hypothetical protein
MLQTKDIETVSAGKYAYAAFLNAESTSRYWRATFTPKQQAQAETFADIVGLAYTNVLKPTFRKTMATIKVNRGLMRDKQMIKEVMQICEERGYRVRSSAQGINFNIPKI